MAAGIRRVSYNARRVQVYAQQQAAIRVAQQRKRAARALTLKSTNRIATEASILLAKQINRQQQVEYTNKTRISRQLGAHIDLII